MINALLRVSQQTTKKWYVKRSCSSNYFSTQHVFNPFLYKKNAYLQLMTSKIYRLDIALAAPKKQSFDFLDERKKRSRNDKLADQHESNNRVRHCSCRDDDIVT